MSSLIKLLSMIDTFAASHPAPDVMLIDIEGSEIDALEGSINTIKRSRPTILVEVHWLDKRFRAFVEQQLEPLGYTCTTYDGKPLPRGDVRYHALLTPSSRVAKESVAGLA